MLLDGERDRTRAIGEAEAEDLIRGICFKTGPPRRTGVEVEWLLQDLHDPAAPLRPERITAALTAVRALPLRSALTVEPGGQLELSSPPADSLSDGVAVMRADLALVQGSLKPHALSLAGHGHDPWHAPRRLLDAPRYTAMESYFDRFGPEGRAMMCSTASVQVCVDAGHEEPGPLGHANRWRLAHLLGPVLVAAFANSPLRQGSPTGWKSTRQAVWTALDPGRALAPAGHADPRSAWAGYALDAPVLCLRTDEGPWDVPVGLTFRDWVRGKGPRAVTADDLAYHLTTLFPPVRPRGHLELRMIDAQPGEEGWIVPLAVTSALFDDPEAAERAYYAVAQLSGDENDGRAPRSPLWRNAARYGLAAPRLQAAADICFTAALESLAGSGAAPSVQSAVARFHERYVSRGRCPADDVLASLPVPLSGKDSSS
ncbi:ergothioneine biosynthesis glutamate--cysteine ligase EgtA [Streptomyces sp. ISL-1]|uniref:ergothioneine biosynthesis glutamate--cysteine ligase EgtA n=1 Tax=Streptomyces sp. ISL-1 TaxID=2817657 RepID=UPI001BE79F2E|nr:ergothioneine biosynthesis glutamate--cysteine ligase EgtA [Streptomyces sp. ISL-1]MBT2387990.1 ergothioneine biosynthesis glutamate--cysteine ligase EgtA [Streptomyces sp. ISL-1]